MHLATPRELIRRQLELEAEARALGVQRFNRSAPLPWNYNAEPTQGPEMADLSTGRKLLRAAVEPTAEAIKRYVDDAINGNRTAGRGGPRPEALKWIELSEPDQLAYLTARSALAASANPDNTATKAAFALGRAVIDNLQLDEFRKKNPEGYAGAVGLTTKGTPRKRAAPGTAAPKAERNKQAHRLQATRRRAELVRQILAKEGVGEAEVSNTELVSLGMVLIELLTEATGLFTLDLVRKRNRRPYYVLRATEVLDHWLAHTKRISELLAPFHMPMVVRPRRWRGPHGAGYLSFGRPLIKSRRRSTVRQALEKADLSLVYEAVNHIQETPWRINRRVLEVMREAWDTGETLAGLPRRDDRPLPPRPENIATDAAALKAWKAEAAAIHSENAAFRSHRYRAAQRFYVAEKFVDEEAIWFPHSLDSRGRVYPIPAAGLHPQSDDAGKALLEFAHGLPLGEAGRFWIAAHIAGLFGKDKLPFSERVSWTWSHAGDLIDSALDPLGGRRFWATADSPWMALAAAFDFAEMLEKGAAHVSRLPIPLDGSNSGLQHLSAVLRDPVGAASVNLLPSSVPQDVYAEVATRAQAFVDADDRPEALPWRGGKVTRKVAKRPTMTFVYSATRFGFLDMILQTLRELDAEGEPYLGGADNFAAALYLSHVLYAAVSETVKAATVVMDWMRSAAKLAAKSDEPLRWTSPDGLPIVQEYREWVGKVVSVHWRGRVVSLKVASDGSKIDARAQANGISPNWTHSLDGSHLRAVARRAAASGISHLGVIHDSFSCHAANTDRLAAILRDTFAEQYGEDVLARFRDELIEQLPPDLALKLRPLPARGTLDIEEVRHATYAFA